MTGDEQRIAIARVCPNIIVRKAGASGWNYKQPGGRILPCIDGDPLADLNAMHEVERCLSATQIDTYLAELLKLVELDWRMCRANAAQRTEAFLRCLNLWK